MHHELAEITWTGIAAAPLLLVPVGSCEQHGPHLPIGTDTLIAAAVASGAAARTPGTLVAPALTITASGEHQGFPGTLSIGTDAMATVLVELVRSADWARGVVLVNGHGGNSEAVRRAAGVLAHEQRPVTVWWPDLREHTTSGDLHAGHAETSLLLALRPDLVRIGDALTGPTPPLPELVRRGVRDLSPSGVLGDPTGASAEAGVRMLAALVDQLVAAIGTTSPAGPPA